MESSDEEKQSPKFESAESKQEIKKKVAFSISTSQEKRDFRDVILHDSDSDDSDSEFFCHVCSKRFSGFIPFKQHEKGKSHAKALQKRKKIKKLEKITISDNVLDESDEENTFFLKPFAVCKTCSKQFGGPESYAMHLASKVHKQKVSLSSILEKVQEDGSVNVEKLKELYKSKNPDDENLFEDKIGSLKVSDDDESTGEFECKECDKIFSGLIPYTQHIMSKVHSKTVKQNKLRENICREEVQESAKSSGRDVSTLAVEDGIIVCKMCTMSFSGPESAVMHLKSRGHSKNLEKVVRRRERKAKIEAAKSRKDSSSSCSGCQDEVDEKKNCQHKSVDPDTNPSDSSSSSSSSSGSSEDELPQNDDAEEGKTTFYSSLQEPESELQQQKDVTADIKFSSKNLSSENREISQTHGASGSKSDVTTVPASDDKIEEDVERTSLSTSERKFLFNSEKYDSYKKAMRSLRDD